MRTFKNGFFIVEILCYLTITIMIGFFVVFVYKTISNNTTKIKNKYREEEEIKLVIEEIENKRMKFSIDEEYYYKITNEYWEIYSSSGFTMVKYYFNDNKIWCHRWIDLKEIKNISIEEKEFIFITVLTENYKVTTILGGYDEYKKETIS